MHAFKPGWIRSEAQRSVRGVARALGIDRKTVALYEACPDLVKTKALRRMLDQYYERMAADVAAIQALRRAREDGSLDEDEPASASVPWFVAA